MNWNVGKLIKIVGGLGLSGKWDSSRNLNSECSLSLVLECTVRAFGDRIEGRIRFPCTMRFPGLFLGMVKPLCLEKMNRTNSSRLGPESWYPRSLVPKVTFRMPWSWSFEEADDSLSKGLEECSGFPWSMPTMVSSGRRGLLVYPIVPIVPLAGKGQSFIYTLLFSHIYLLTFDTEEAMTHFHWFLFYSLY